MKTCSSIVSYILLLYNFSSFCQVPEIEWQNAIGGSGLDNLRSIQQTTDNGYIMGGYTTSDSSFDKSENCKGIVDYWVVKIRACGDIEWENTIGGDDFDYLRSVYQTTDNGYILGGSSISGVSGDKTEDWLYGYDYWIVKLTESGTIEWQNTIGGTGSEYVYSLQQTTDGGYIIGGFSKSDSSADKTENSFGYEDYWVVKLNSTGSIEWQRTIGGSGYDELSELQQTADGGYILGGMSRSEATGNKTEDNVGFASYDYWVVKLSSTGSIEWQNDIGGTGSDNLKSISQTLDGGYIMSGMSDSDISGDKTQACFGSFDCWVVKLDKYGVIQWEKTIGGSGYEYMPSVRQTLDGGYILGISSGSGISGLKTEPSFGTFDYWVVKLDSAGLIEWQKTIGGSYDEYLNSIEQTSDGGFILGGDSWSGATGNKTEESMGSPDYWVVKLTCEDYTVFYADEDGDGFGDPDGDVLKSCSTDPCGYVEDSTDCDDLNGAIFPGAAEVCNYIDDNCDGYMDENTVSVHLYADTDGDGYGDMDNDTISCDSVPGYIPDFSDCNDSNAYIYPGAPELLNDLDDDCNGITDDIPLNVQDILSAVTVYPNPVTSVLQIDNPFQKEMSVSITNLTGQIIYFDQLKYPAFITVTEFPPGVYFLKLGNTETQALFKFIKE